MRLQLALNVTDLDEAIDFYSKMFGAEPAKVKSGYANFAIDNPPLKLVLFEVGSDHPEAAVVVSVGLVRVPRVEPEGHVAVAQSSASPSCSRTAVGRSSASSMRWARRMCASAKTCASPESGRCW